MSEKRYGQWAGNKLGYREDMRRCTEEVWPSSRAAGFISMQCSRPRGHGKDGAYCSVHGRDNSKKVPLSRHKGDRE